MNYGLCDTCFQRVPSTELVWEDSHESCEVCRGLKSVNADTRAYFNGADLAEDSGIFDPAEAGFTYVEGLGWTK